MGRPRLHDKDLPPRVYRRHGAYYYAPNGKVRAWIRLSGDKREALAKWAELVSAPPSPGVTLAELVSRYLVEVAARKAPATHAGNLQESKALLAVFGHMRPEDVRPVHVSQFMAIRGQDAPIRANREKALLSSVFAYAIRWGLVEANPCRDVKGYPEKGRDRYITDEEFAAVRALAGEKIGLMMDFAYLTAMRQGDMLALRIDQIDSDGFTLAQGKTGKRQRFPMVPALRAAVDAAHKLHPELKQRDTLFFSRTGQPYTAHGFKTVWTRVQQAWAAKGGERFTWHDIRAKALTDAKRRHGIDAQALAGHASSAMTDHYIKRREIEEVTPLPALPGAEY